MGGPWSRSHPPRLRRAWRPALRSPARPPRRPARGPAPPARGRGHGRRKGEAAMKAVWVIVRKEWREVFRNRMVIFTVAFLPLILTALPIGGLGAPRGGG